MIGDFAVDEIWVKAHIDDTQHGQPIYGTPRKARGRWAHQTRLVTDKQGRSVQSNTTITLEGTDSVAVGDRVSRDGTEYLEVIAVKEGRGLGGAALTKRLFC